MACEGAARTSALSERSEKNDGSLKEGAWFAMRKCVQAGPRA